MSWRHASPPVDLADLTQGLGLDRARDREAGHRRLVRRQEVGGKRVGGGRRAGQVVVGNRGVIGRDGISRAVLDREADCLRERDRVLDVPAVRGDARARLVLDDHAVVGGRVHAAVKVPARREVVLGARALDVRRGRAVDVDHFVPLKEVQRLAGHEESGADVVPRTLSLEDRVVASRRRRVFAAELRMEGARVGRHGIQRRVVDVVVEGVNRPARPVCQRPPRGSVEGHRPVAVVPARGFVEGHRDEVLLLAESDAEKCADRALDARILLAVPVHAQDRLA